MKKILTALFMIVSVNAVAGSVTGSALDIINTSLYNQCEQSCNSDHSFSNSSNGQYLERALLASNDIGLCMGDCASEQGVCIGQCQGNGQCIANCAAAHGRCVARCH